MAIFGRELARLLTERAPLGLVALATSVAIAVMGSFQERGPLRNVYVTGAIAGGLFLMFMVGFEYYRRHRARASLIDPRWLTAIRELQRRSSSALHKSVRVSVMAPVTAHALRVGTVLKETGDLVRDTPQYVARSSTIAGVALERGRSLQIVGPESPSTFGTYGATENRSEAAFPLRVGSRDTPSGVIALEFLGQVAPEEMAALDTLVGEWLSEYERLVARVIGSLA